MRWASQLLTSLTGGQVHELKQAEVLLEKIRCSAFLANKAYDANALIKPLEKRQITPFIPSRSNRRDLKKTDLNLYKERNLVERFFNTIRYFRCIATRYNNLASTFHGAIHLIAAAILFN
jgi:transposase